MKRVKMYVAGLISGVIMASVLFASAEMAEVFFNKITVKVNGSKVAEDNILYNGRTFVPLRAISENLGKEVIWNGDTSTAEINDKLPAGWSEVVTFEGDTSRNTEGFKITGSDCRVTWDYQGDGYFGVTAYNSNEKYDMHMIANTTEAGNEVTYIKGKGEYYLKIMASGKYKIKIEQQK